MAFCGFLWVLEMNAIALALTGLNPLNPTSGACAATTALPATSEARRSSSNRRRRGRQRAFYWDDSHLE